MLDFLEKEKLHTGFGNVIKDANSYDDVLRQAGLNWSVDTYPAYTELNGKKIEIPNTNVVVRLDDEKPLGMVSSKYKIVNNIDAFSFTESIFNSKEIEFIRGGSYRGGSSTWLESKLTGKYSILGDDTTCYMLFLNSHDGTGSVKALIVPNRVVCSNALNIPIKGQLRHWRCTHTGDISKKVEEARKVLLTGSSYMEALNKECEVLQKIKITSTDINNMIHRLFPITSDMNESYKNIQEAHRIHLSEVFYLKDDLTHLGSSGYRFISAVADYADHVESKRSTKNGNINRFMQVSHGHPWVDKAYEMVLAI